MKARGERNNCHRCDSVGVVCGLMRMNGDEFHAPPLGRIFALSLSLCVDIPFPFPFPFPLDSIPMPFERWSKSDTGQDSSTVCTACPCDTDEWSCCRFALSRIAYVSLSLCSLASVSLVQAETNAPVSTQIGSVAVQRPGNAFEYQYRSYASYLSTLPSILSLPADLDSARARATLLFCHQTDQLSSTPTTALRFLYMQNNRSESEAIITVGISALKCWSASLWILISISSAASSLLLPSPPFSHFRRHSCRGRERQRWAAVYQRRSCSRVSSLLTINWTEQQWNQ